MKRIYTITVTDLDLDKENEGTPTDAINALKNGDLPFADLLELATGNQYFTVDYKVKDEK